MLNLIIKLNCIKYYVFTSCMNIMFRSRCGGGLLLDFVVVILIIVYIYMILKLKSTVLASLVFYLRSLGL